MLAVVFALSSSVIWGVCDFAGGVLARRFTVAAVVVLAQLAALIGAIAVAAGAGETATQEGIFLGLGAGAFAAVSVSAFYSAMNRGMISVASPLLASGSVLAFGLAVAAGERPSALAIFGSALAVTGAVLTSLAGSSHRARRTGAITLAIVAAIALGFALFLLGRASEETGSTFAVLAQRTSSCLLLVAVSARIRPKLRIEARWLAVIAGIGLGTSVALLLYGFAATHGMISTVSILASMYPVVTVMLAHTLLGERLISRQLVGVCLVLAGVGLIAAGR
jgi:drug/metabolite transporter (DMT)-like permease